MSNFVVQFCYMLMKVVGTSKMKKCYQFSYFNIFVTFWKLHPFYFFLRVVCIIDCLKRMAIRSVTFQNGFARVPCNCISFRRRGEYSIRRPLQLVFFSFFMQQIYSYWLQFNLAAWSLNPRFLRITLLSPPTNCCQGIRSPCSRILGSCSHRQLVYF